MLNISTRRLGRFWSPVLSRVYSNTSGNKKKTINTIRSKYQSKTPISVITAYDYTSARLSDEAGFDVLLVGDSLGMLHLGYDTTTKVTIAEMLIHCKSVSRTAKHAFLIGDMSFGSYLTIDDAVHNACLLIKEGGMHAVKLEGGERIADKVSSIVDTGISVMGHIGLTPQTATALGGYKVQGTTAKGALQLLQDAISLQNSGCFSIVLECIPEKIAMEITKTIDIPTIGIGAGRYTNGQVQTFHDTIGLYVRGAGPEGRDLIKPKFAKAYTDTEQNISIALKSFRAEIQENIFPSEEHIFKIKEKKYQDFLNKK